MDESARGLRRSYVIPRELSFAVPTWVVIVSGDLNIVSPTSHSARDGARYGGARHNLFGLRRCRAIQNLETSHLRETEKAA